MGAGSADYFGRSGIYFTLRTGFFQLRKTGEIFRCTLGSLFGKNKADKASKDKHAITPFQAMTTALAGTLGTGNLVGVATAIVLEAPARCSGCGSALFSG